MPSALRFCGNALKAEMFEHGREYTLTIRDVAEREFDNGDRKLELSFIETDKLLVLNVTNTRSIVELHGDDYADWPNRKINLLRTTTDYGGRRVACIRIGSPATPSQAAPQPQQPDPDPGGFREETAALAEQGGSDIPF